MASQKAKAVSDSAQKAAQISVERTQVHRGYGRRHESHPPARWRRSPRAWGGCASRARPIGQIIATVEDLAAQSNLLAVNAAIEAAKAGEHGKGFGVVAQEVKSLAEQSRQATNQVRTILSDIQKATTAAVMATEQGGKSGGGRRAGRPRRRRSIQTLAGSVPKRHRRRRRSPRPASSSWSGMDQVAAAMESIKQASTQNVASAKQLETSARSLESSGAAQTDGRTLRGLNVDCLRAKSSCKLLRATFRVEAAEHLHAIGSGAAGAGEVAAPGGSAGSSRRIFRAAHSLKGAARAVNFTEIESLSASRSRCLFATWKRGDSAAAPRRSIRRTATLDKCRA